MTAKVIPIKRRRCDCGWVFPTQIRIRNVEPQFGLSKVRLEYACPMCGNVFSHAATSSKPISSADTPLQLVPPEPPKGGGKKPN